MVDNLPAQQSQQQQRRQTRGTSNRPAPARPTPAATRATMAAAAAGAIKNVLARRSPQLMPGTDTVVHEDETGRKWTVLVPAGHLEEAEMGLIVGPPDTSSLGLPEAEAVRLHNELQGRGLLTANDLRGREREILAALQSAFRIDIVAIVAAYHATS